MSHRLYDLDGAMEVINTTKELPSWWMRKYHIAGHKQSKLF